MRLWLALLLSSPAVGQPPEDAAHRADRLETARLNEDARRHSGPARISGRDRRAYQRALDDYEARLDAWRRRVADCERGRYEACE